MTRKEAIQSGSKHYHSKPCKVCNETLKFVSGYSCVKCVTERTVNRDPEVGKRYIKSDKGQRWLSEFRTSDTNKSIQNRYHKQRYKSDPEYYKNRNMINRYGIGLDQYQLMLEQQNYSCAICGKHQTQTAKGHLVIDHCHDSNIIRKLLCSSCNVALGMAYEDVDILYKMIDYVREFKENRDFSDGKVC
jgi:hypothetical protein